MSAKKRKPTYFDELSSKDLPKFRPLTITVTNEKGGVGKTTITRYIPYVLAKLGYKCLVIDNDPQGNLTNSLLVTKNLLNDTDDYLLRKTMMDAIRENSMDNMIINILPNLDMAPSTRTLIDFEAFLTKKYGNAETIDSNYKEITKPKLDYFKLLVEQVKESYDFVFIDTPPTVSMYTETATYASDYIILSFQTQSDSLDGVDGYVKYEFESMINDFGSDVDIVGLLPNQLGDGSIDWQVVEDAKDSYGEEGVFTNILPKANRVQRAPRQGLTIQDQWDRKLVYETFSRITEEFIQRIDKLEGER